MYVIKAIYPSGGHVLMLNDQPMRFADKQQAAMRAEVLNAEMKKINIETSYIVVEESL